VVTFVGGRTVASAAVVHRRPREPRGRCAQATRRTARERAGAATIRLWDAGLLLRAVRRARGLSQRDLAELAGVRRSTIDRIESGQTRAPSLTLVERILRSSGHALVIADHHGRLLELDEEHERLTDHAGRHLPAHLPYFRVEWSRTYWWGWTRVAWSPSDPTVPEWSYYRPGRLRDYFPEHWWLDAT
jgi:transcriptional regulator with XRE-family HTH domain